MHRPVVLLAAGLVAALTPSDARAQAAAARPQRADTLYLLRADSSGTLVLGAHPDGPPAVVLHSGAPTAATVCQMPTALPTRASAGRVAPGDTASVERMPRAVPRCAPPDGERTR